MQGQDSTWGPRGQVAILSKSIETPMSCDEVEFPTWKLKRLNFLSLHHIDGCVTLLFLSFRDLATGLFCCSTLVIYWLPRFIGFGRLDCRNSLVRWPGEPEMGPRCVLSRESEVCANLYFIRNSSFRIWTHQWSWSVARDTRKFEVEYGGDEAWFYKHYLQGFRWKYGRDHHGAGSKPCTCDYCRCVWVSFLPLLWPLLLCQGRGYHYPRASTRNGVNHDTASTWSLSWRLSPSVRSSIRYRQYYFNYFFSFNSN